MVERIFLVGMMGAGKTSAGAVVASRLGWRFLDSDAEIERVAGRTVAEIFDHRGEAAFRAQEASFVARACTEDTPAVVSLGGGAVMDVQNRQRMTASGLVVWVRAREDTLAERVANGAGRPLLSGDPLEKLRKLIARRRPLYAEVSDVVIDVDSLSPAEVADRIVAAFHRSRAAGGVARADGRP